jgi:hypothetical protein
VHYIDALDCFPFYDTLAEQFDGLFLYHRLGDRSIKEITMTKTKILTLAAFAVLSLGAGSAMAQDGDVGGDYWSRQRVIPAQRAANPIPAALPVPSGASDVEKETGSAHSPAFILNHQLYGAGGVAG